MERFDVAAALERIAHRGPDGSGIASSGPATHGHVRLALLDLSSASAQPFKHGGDLLTFVGEIWNYRDLRGQLRAAGHKFKTTGDTEVLAHALAHWGVAQTLSRIEGMFTFAWSSRRGDHVLARDRFGKIPLHVHRRGRAFVWASEMKALGPDYPSAPLGAGQMLNLNTGSLDPWYRPPRDGRRSEGVLDMLKAGVKARLVTDAPICCLVSGGLDSSLILSLAREAMPGVVAYTAKLEDGAADLDAARRLCAEWEVPLVEVKVPAPSSDDLSAAMRAIELPSKAQVEIAALCIPLARAIASDGFKSCLSGEAADELFGGYGSMCIKGASADDLEWQEIRLGQLDKMARGNFMRCNKAFMAAGVECRLPFMHRPLVEAVLAMSKAECPPGKKALKAAARGALPRWVISRQKDTFQGGSGMAAAAARAVADPRAFYAAEFKREFAGHRAA